MTRWSRRRFGGALSGAACAMLGAAAAAPGSTEQRTHRVEIRRFAYAPAHLTIAAGDSVEWVNHDIAPHTATADDGTWTSRTLSRADVGRVAFPTPGIARYHCTHHPAMRAVVEVI